MKLLNVCFRETRFQRIDVCESRKVQANKRSSLPGGSEERTMSKHQDEKEGIWEEIGELRPSWRSFRMEPAGFLLGDVEREILACPR